VVEHLPIKHKALSSNPSTAMKKGGGLSHSCYSLMVSEVRKKSLLYRITWTQTCSPWWLHHPTDSWSLLLDPVHLSSWQIREKVQETGLNARFSWPALQTSLITFSHIPLFRTVFYARACLQPQGSWGLSQSDLVWNRRNLNLGGHWLSWLNSLSPRF
jgi:hypothetical protein